MKKPKFNAASVNNESTIFDELLTCYKSTEFYFFVKTDTPTHIRHLWRTIFLSAAWVAIVLFATLLVKFLPDEAKVCLIISTFFILPIFHNLKRYIYYEDEYVPLNIYRRKLIENFISSHATDYRSLADRLIQICNNESDSDAKAISIALIGSLVTVFVMIFGFAFSYTLEGYKEFLMKNNCPLFEPQAIDVFMKIIYIFIIPIVGFIFYIYILPRIGVTKSDKVRTIAKLIQESLLEKEFRKEK